MYQQIPDTYPSTATCAVESILPSRFLLNIATMSGTNAIQQNTLRHEGTGPAIANGNACNKADTTESNQRRRGIDRIGLESSSPQTSRFSATRTFYLQFFSIHPHSLSSLIEKMVEKRGNNTIKVNCASEPDCVLFCKYELKNLSIFRYLGFVSRRIYGCT